MNYAADTSFLIGLFVDEPRTQKTRDLFQQLKARREKVYVPAQAIVEVIYVLEKFYKLERPKVAEYVQAILDTFIFIVEKYELFYRVLKLYKEYSSINVGDIIIAEEVKSQKISHILTFDPHFKKLNLQITNI
jgi:predicted nucleic-acid-binding protein